MLWLEAIVKNAITLGSINSYYSMFLAILAMEFLTKIALFVLLQILENKLEMNVLAF